MDALSLVWFGHEVAGSFAAGGLLSGAYAVGNALLGPLVGRMADRLSMRRTLLAAAVLHALTLVALVALGLAGAPLVALAAVAALAGGSFPPVTAARRRLWSRLIGDDPRVTDAAYALDALGLETVFVGGPVIVAVLLGIASPAAALLVGAALPLVGTAWFAATPPLRDFERPAAMASGLAGALATPGMPMMIGTTIVMAVTFGAPAVALSAFALERGAPDAVGVLLALQGVGSVLGGIVYGVVGGRRGTVVGRYVAIGAALPLSFALLAGAPSLVLLGVLMPISGLALTPMAAERLRIIAGIAHADSMTEAFTWSITAVTLGQALGTMLTGLLLTFLAWQIALLATCAVGLLGALLAWTGRAAFAPARR
jgi:MFS family permease